MIRMLFILVVAASIGWLGARIESSRATTGYEERFSSSRESLAERRGDATKAELLAAAQGTPKVEVVGGPDFAFGTMQHGETMSHEFTLRNIGDGPLNLEMGKTTCKCTIGDLTESVLQPGEETKVKLTWTAQSLMRQFGQTANIITTDPQATEVKLTVHGQVVDSFFLEPSELDVGDFRATDGVERSFYVIDYLEGKADLEDLHWTDKSTVDLVDLSFKKMDVDLERFPEHTGGKGMFEVKVRIKPGMLLGRLKGHVRFSTSLGEDIGMLEVPIRGTATGDVSLIGGSSFNPKLNLVQFGTVKSSAGSKITIFMRVSEKLASEGTPEVVNVTPRGSLKASIGEGRKKGSSVVFPVHFEIPKGAKPVSLVGPKADLFGQVTIRTEGESGGELPIYCRMIVVE